VKAGETAIYLVNGVPGYELGSDTTVLVWLQEKTKTFVSPDERPSLVALILKLRDHTFVGKAIDNVGCLRPLLSVSIERVIKKSFGLEVPSLFKSS
jgi:hypothetical protein